MTQFKEMYKCCTRNEFKVRFSGVILQMESFPKENFPFLLIRRKPAYISAHLFSSSHSNGSVQTGPLFIYQGGLTMNNPPRCAYCSFKAHDRVNWICSKTGQILGIYYSSLCDNPIPESCPFKLTKEDDKRYEDSKKFEAYDRMMRSNRGIAGPL